MIIAVCFGLISAEPMALVVSADADTNKNNSWAHVRNATCYYNDIAPAQNNSLSNTYKGRPTMKKIKV